MAKQITTNATNPIVLLVEDPISNYRIRVFSYPGLADQFNFPLHLEPEIFEVIDSSLFITGWDTNGTYMLYHFSAFQDSLFATYALNNSSSNAHELLKIGNSLSILSSPGDSITTLDLMTATLSQSIVYPQSGARATYNEFQNDKKFTFQPMDSLLNKQILVLDPITGQFTDTLMINHILDWFKHPNPTTSELNILFTLNESTNAGLQLFNSLGQAVKEISEQKLNVGENKINFSTDNLPAGVYYLKFSAGERSVMKKVVKM